MSCLIKSLILSSAILVPVSGGCAEVSVDQALEKSHIVDSTTDILYNIETLRRLDKGDIDGAKDLIRQAICSDQAELEQLQNSANISSRIRQMAENSIKNAREFKTSDAIETKPPLCVPTQALMD